MIHNSDCLYSESGNRVSRGFFFAVYLSVILTLNACSPLARTESTSTTSTSIPTTRFNIPSLASTREVSPQITRPASETVASDPEISPATDRPPIAVEPLLIRNNLRFDSWSPNSQWVAYWQGENGEETSASLGFVNVQTGMSCPHEEVTTDNLESGYVMWQDDASFIVITDANASMWSGGDTPCAALALVQNDLHTNRKGEFSPNGRYQAVTTSTPDGQLLHNTVIITDTLTNQMTVTYTWDTSVHAVKGGPNWLTNELYLIGQTFPQDILYLSLPNGQVGNVLTDLLKQKIEDQEATWWLFSQTDPTTEAYHLLLQWWGGESTWSPLLLYHSELDQVEELPFYRARPFNSTNAVYGFSPDGRWLLVGNPVGGSDPANDSGQDYWIRPIDSPNNSFIQISAQAALGGMSGEGEQMAFIENHNSIYVVTFPDGQLLSQWFMPGYVVDRLWWAPDGIHLAVWGIDQETGQEALFVLTP